MKLLDLLKQNRKALLEEWQNLILETYPTDSVPFLQDQKNRFANPVGHAIRQETEILLDQLLNDMDAEALSASLDNIVRIRAVQDFTPSRAVEFVYFLKAIIRRQYDSSEQGRERLDELRSLEDRVDSMSLVAFDLYSQRRDRLADVRVHEAQRRTHKLVDRINAIYTDGNAGSQDNSDKNE